MTMRDVSDASGVLVINVWTEPGASRPFRARLTFDGTDPQSPATSTLACSDDVVDAVRAWLAEFCTD